MTDRIQINPVALKNPVWDTPLIPPLPASVFGVAFACIDLNERLADGTWQFLFSPISQMPLPTAEHQDFPLEILPAEGWKPVCVPSELAMQGFDIENNTEYYYQRMIRIPEDFAGHQIFLRFDGVYSNARCWINGHFIRSHSGGFTSWDCDITAFAKAGETVLLTVGIADLEGSASGIYNPDGKVLGDSSWASYYAHHNIGGILRDVTLFAVPCTYLSRLHTATHFDRNFVNAILEITVQLSGELRDTALVVDLIDAEGVCVISQMVSCLPEDAMRISIPVLAPHHWDAEHPYLYTLVVSLQKREQTLYTVSQKLGFRELHYGGRDGTEPNKLYVNGKEIKLRGTCRHDVSLRAGRSTTREEDWQEIQAYRDANINHIRTSHYPASRHLLDACDALGIYVEQENSACFQGANGYDIHSAPEHFISSFAEMVERDRNRASVILWSLGNESGFERTSGYRTEYEYIKAEDPSRPVIFSYPDTVETFPLPYDVCSRHYESVKGLLGGAEIPVLHDEFAHISCYNLKELQRDPNVRNFWGAGLKSAWEQIFQTDGALGAALWGGVDDVFLLPDGVQERWQSHSDGKAAGYGEWGSILDVYRRWKPEAYLTKKAYSPVYLEEQKLQMTEDRVSIPIQNRFDHTCFSELICKCSVDGGQERLISLPELAPHSRGLLQLSGNWKTVNQISLRFFFMDRLIDAAVIRLQNCPAKKSVCLSTPKLTETAHEIQITAGKFCYCFSKSRALLLRAGDQKQDLLKEGPFLHLEGVSLPAWKPDRAPYVAIQNHQAVVMLQGHYGEAARVQFIIRISGDGKMTTEYQSRNHALNPALISEIGIRYRIPSDAFQIQWERKGLYSVYPENHIGRNCGVADRIHPQAVHAKYHTIPEWDWKDDLYNPFLFAEDDPNAGLATNDFKAMKEHILNYRVHFSSGVATVCAESDGDAAARISVCAEEMNLIVNQQWYYPQLGWGNWTGKPVSITTGGIRGMIQLRLE